MKVDLPPSSLGLSGNNFDSTPSPRLFSQHSGLEQAMTNYCKDYCPSVTSHKMNLYIQQGEALEDLIIKSKPGELELTSSGHIQLGDREITKEEAVVSMMWLLMAKAGRYGEHHTNGVIRLTDPDQKLEKFLHQCGKDQIYPRVSSHMREHLNLAEKDLRLSLISEKGQFGFDLRDQGLPAEKHTLLFTRLKDGSLYLKMERNGCPPIWLGDRFLSGKNIKEFLRHTTDYIVTRFIPSGNSTGQMKATRKEHLPKDIKKEFKEVMELINPPLSLGAKISRILRPQPLTLQEKEYKASYAKGHRGGLSIMNKVLNQLLEDKTIDESVRKEIHNLSKKITVLTAPKHERGYEGAIKGEEAILPALGEPLKGT